MHMADALISPAVGGTLAAAAAGIIGYSSRKIKMELDDRKIPLMGVLGAFVFAAQMINFTIPATGSSGHLGGGLILAILLGPHAAFLTMGSILIVQALFFADGGILALGCNIINLGFLPCYIAYPYVYKKIAGDRPTRRRVITGAVAAAVVGLQLGAFSVVLQIWSSGVSELPLGAFALLMQPIHLAIGLVEGIATAALVIFIWRTRPEILTPAAGKRDMDIGAVAFRQVLIALLAAAVLVGGVLSWFASSHPDGLEWSMMKAGGTAEFETSKQGLRSSLENIQNKTVILPDYAFRGGQLNRQNEKGQPWPVPDPGASVSGLVGGGLTLMTTLLTGWALRRRKVSATPPPEKPAV